MHTERVGVVRQEASYDTSFFFLFFLFLLEGVCSLFYQELNRPWYISSICCLNGAGAATMDRISEARFLSPGSVFVDVHIVAEWLKESSGAEQALPGRSLRQRRRRVGSPFGGPLAVPRQFVRDPVRADKAPLEEDVLCALVSTRPQRVLQSRISPCPDELLAPFVLRSFLSETKHVSLDAWLV